MQCVILCGGRATRLGALVNNLPKSLLQCNKHPFIHYQLSWLKTQGIDDVLLCVGYLAHMIEEYVSDGSKWGLRVFYTYDGSTPLGTGGALRKALDEGKLEEKFFILWGDSYLPINLEPIVKAFNEQALMTMYHNQGQWDKSNIKLLDDNKILYDKQISSPDYNYIDYGLSLLNRKLVEEIPEGKKYDLANFFYQLGQNNLLQGYKVNERFYEIGSQQGIQDFIQYINDANKL